MFHRIIAREQKLLKLQRNYADLNPSIQRTHIARHATKIASGESVTELR